MKYSLFLEILPLALWESFLDLRTRWEVGIPMVTGTYGLLLGFAMDLSLITICLGAATAALGIVEKGIKVYKEIKSLKEKKSSEKEESEEDLKD